MTSAGKADVTIRQLQENDLHSADRIVRLAFGTFLGLPDPMTFMGDAAYVRTRWLADPTAAFGAQLGDEIVGSNFATNWGSVGFFGPLTVHPDLWNQSVAQKLMEPIIGCFERWGTKHAGLYTFSHSLKHVRLYQKFGFWPRFLTAIMSKSIEPPPPVSSWSRLSELKENDRNAAIRACRELTDAIFDGLDVGREIQALLAQKLGEVVLLWEGSNLIGLAVCHCGPGTEAGSHTCYIKFGAARPGPSAGQTFGRLLEACEGMAGAQGLSRIVAGVNTSRHDAYRRMIASGFSTEIQGVTMHKPNEAGYSRPDVYLIDDWR